MKITYFLKYRELQTGRHQPKSNLGTSIPLKKTNVYNTPEDLKSQRIQQSQQIHNLEYSILDIVRQSWCACRDEYAYIAQNM